MGYYKDKQVAHDLIMKATKECYEENKQLDAVKLYYQLFIKKRLIIGRKTVKEYLELAKTEYPLAEIIRLEEL